MSLAPFSCEMFLCYTVKVKVGAKNRDIGIIIFFVMASLIEKKVLIYLIHVSSVNTITSFKALGEKWKICVAKDASELLSLTVHQEPSQLLRKVMQHHWS